MTKLIRIWSRYWLVILSALITALVCLSILLSYFSRNYAIDIIKSHVEKVSEALQVMGYDIAYDELAFYSMSPWQIMRVKNFKIYSLDESNFWQWNVDELSVDVGVWDNDKIDIFLGNKQSFQYMSSLWKIAVSDVSCNLNFEKESFKNLHLNASGVSVKNLLVADSVDIKIKKDDFSYFNSELDAKGITIDDMTGWALNKKIDHAYVNTLLQLYLGDDVTLSEAIYEWVDRGGKIDIKKLILNWKPLIVVANGDVEFNEKNGPVVSLNTASLALLETLDRLNENGYISNKGTFVSKILLNNKAVQQKPSDKYKTIVTPLKISKDAITLENIKIR